MTPWTINGRFLSQPVTGVQRYAREITAAIDKSVAESSAAYPEIQILVPSGTPPPPRYRRLVTRTVGSQTGHLWEQLDLPRYSPGPLLSLANTGPVAKRDHVVCIHDANTRVIPESYSRSFRFAYRLLHPALGRAARHVMTVSHHAAAELARFRIAHPSRISVAPNGADHAARWNPWHTLATAAVASPATIVLLGSQAPHKNIRIILELAPALSAAGFRIAVVGMSAAAFSQDGTHPIHPSVHMLGRVEDDALAALLRESLCLAFPSLTEGFGLPPLEAMMHDCPVIASTAASIPEVCGDAALYADPRDPRAWYDALCRLRDDDDLRRSLIARGRVRSAAFTWEASANLYLAALRDTAEASAREPVIPRNADAPPARTYRD